MSVVIYEKKGQIAHLTINRPDTMNALSMEVLTLLRDAWEDFNKDDALRVAILTGAGDRAFSAGADLKEIAGLSQEERKAMKRPGGIHKGVEVWKPVIAAVNGVAAGGGCELALACDIRIASEAASFSLPEVGIGAIPGGGGTQRLPRAIPLGIAMEMLMTGKRIDAAEAYRIGLVNRVVPLKDLHPTAASIAEEICKKGPLAVKAVKDAALKGLDLPLSEGLKLETSLAVDLRGTEDALEGPRAFAEKRPPIFKGK